MIEVWREILYPIGFVAQLVFGSRMLWQWFNSEMRQESTVTPIFWQLSLLGNILLMVHSTFQSQYHVFAVQVSCGVISWRNLNLLRPSSSHWKTRSVLLLMVSVLLLTTWGFIAFNGMEGWFRVPTSPWNQQGRSVALWWHLLGCVGLLLFSSRFWLQWIFAERNRKSELGPSFWWVSILGHSLLLLYYFRIMDVANLLGPLFAMIPYIRNIRLLRQERA